MAISYTNFVANGTLTVNAQPNITSVGNLTSLTVTGTSNLGNVGNVKITGGGNNYLLATDGTGNLVWSQSTEGFLAAYSVPFQGVPIYANSTANRNIPLTFIGVDPGANYIYPYLQGTSDIANGYIANSTAAWTPANASFINGNYQANQIANSWYLLTSRTFSSDAVGKSITSYVTFTVYGNTAGIEFQVVPWIGNSSNGMVTLFTGQMHGFINASTDPYTYSYTITGGFGGIASNEDVTGLHIRNITANSELTVTSLTNIVTIKT